MENKYADYLDSPIGWVKVEANDNGLTAVSFTERPDGKQVQLSDITDQAVQELNEYFDGHRQIFTIPLSISGTEFQKRVWQAVGSIPFGESRTYKEIATATGDEKKVRAIGTANGANPLLIVIPCHRVLGPNLALTGYAAGLERKEWLLRHEGILKQASLF